MDRQPYIYTLPEQFISDKSVPLHWKLYTLINGFWIAGKPVFASNAFFAEKIGCSERHVRECLSKLEEMNLLERVGESQNRRIVPKGGATSSSQGGAHSSVRAEPTAPHISDSISDSITIAEDGEGPYGSGEVINAFMGVNPSWKTLAWKSQANAARRLIGTHGLENVLHVIRLLPQTNQEPYFTPITTPIELERGWAKLGAKLAQKQAEVTRPKTRGRGFA